jgi:tRNA-dihydrouridine synthase A
VFIVHARKAWLSGLSPKENREIPPLDYARVYRLKAARPELEVIINGGIETLEACSDHLARVDGVMLGRAAYHTPWLLTDVDRALFGLEAGAVTRAEVLAQLIPYAERHIAGGGRLSNITRHILGLYHGRPRGKLFRRYLSENAVMAGASASVIAKAVEITESSASVRMTAAV